MGVLDRVLRLIATIAVIGLYYSGVISGTLAIVLLVFAGIFLFTSLIGSCPLYYPFGINTKSKGK